MSSHQQWQETVAAQEEYEVSPEFVDAINKMIDEHLAQKECDERTS